MHLCTAIVYNQTSNNTVDGSLQAADNPAHDSPDGLFAIMVKQGTSETMYYVHKDYHGSITAITDSSGNLVESLSYDPWGRRRNASNWNDYNVTSTMFDRGFTGHEHLPQFGLINMNGRVYDPFLARFLSPDPFVQAPYYSQNFNRYSYAFNNPLKYTDPSGEIIFTALCLIIPGAQFLLPLAITMDIAGGLNAWNHRGVIKEGWQEGKWKGVGQGLAYYGIGGGQAAATYYLGPFGSIAGTYGGEALNALVDDGKITEGEYNVEQITANAIVNLAVAGVGVGDKIGTGSTKWIGNEFAKNVTKNLIQQNVDGLISSVVYES